MMEHAIPVIPWIVFFAALLTLVTFLLAKAPAGWNVVFFTAVSILIPSYLVATSFQTLEGFFGPIKFLTLCVTVLLIAGLRFWGWRRKPLARTLFYLIVVVNIAEAVGFETLDLALGGPERKMGGNVLNVLAGIILVLTQALPRKVSVSDSPDRGLRYDLGVFWILAYTLWDFTFLYGTNPPDRPTGEWTGLAVIHLSAPLFLMGRDGALYAQMRVYSLWIVAGLALIVPFEPWLYRTPEWHNRSLSDALAFASLGLTALLFVQQLRAGTRAAVPANPVQLLGRRVFGRKR